MSVSSLGIIAPSELANSELSLLSHSDIDQSPLDSLQCSLDSLILNDEFLMSEDDMSAEYAYSEDILKQRPRLSDKQLMKNTDTKGQSKDERDRLNNRKADENGNENSWGGTDKPKPVTSSKERSPAKRSRIPKSRTFDSTTSMNSIRNGSLKETGNGPNHVFMTSQECMVVPGSSKIPRQTIASRLRYEKHGKESPQGSMGLGDVYAPLSPQDGYQTPTQRKDVLMRDLRRQVREARTMCEEKDREIEMYKQHVDDETSKLVQSKDKEIEKLRDELRKLKQSYEDISNFCEESISTASAMEQKAEDLKHAMDDREKEHQKIYLEMYKRGQDSARFEREEEYTMKSSGRHEQLERLASSGGCKVTISELVKKLAWTELELAKWQTIRRQESYHEAAQPENESYTTLRFLKDAFFHYITDEKESDHHLRAMIKIFKYTDPQMQKIRESRLIEAYERRNRKRVKKSRCCDPSK